MKKEESEESQIEKTKSFNQVKKNNVMKSNLEQAWEWFNSLSSEDRKSVYENKYFRDVSLCTDSDVLIIWNSCL